MKGHINKKWYAFFEGLQVSLLSDGNTQISGNMRDQSELHGLLNKIRDLGIPLVKVEQKKPVS